MSTRLADPARSITAPAGFSGVDLTTPPVTTSLVAHYAARLESFSDGDAVGTLADQQNSNDLTQSTSSKKPTYRDNGTDNINGLPVIEFDGSDDELNAGLFTTSTTGEVIAVFRTVTLDVEDTLLAFTDKSAGDSHVRLLVQDSDTNNHIGVKQIDGGTVNQIEGDTSIGDSEVRLTSHASDGTDWRLFVDGTEQTESAIAGSDSGAWAGDVTNGDAVSVGAVLLDSDAGFVAMELAELLIYEKELSSTERTQDYDWLNDDVGYGIF